MIGVVLVGVVVVAMLLDSTAPVRPTDGAPSIVRTPITVHDDAGVDAARLVVSDDSASERSPSHDPTAAQIAAERTMRVRVLDERRRPVAGAAVRMSTSRDMPWPEASIFGPQLNDHVHSDVDGFATLRASPQDTVVAARFGDRFAERTFDASVATSPIEIVFRDPRPLLVRVVDANGVPCGGVPVALSVGRPERCAWVVDRTTDAATGIATFDAMEALLLDRAITTTRRYGGTPGDPALWITPRTRATDGVGVRTTLLRIDAAPLELRLPAEGRIRVQMEGTPPLGVPCTLRLVALRRDLPEPGDGIGDHDYLMADFARAMAGDDERTVLDGSASEFPVAIGGRYGVWLRLGSTGEVALARVHGPALPRQSVDVRLAWPAASELVGRLVAPDGAPIVNGRVTFRATDSSTFGLRTDANGTFRAVTFAHPDCRRFVSTTLSDDTLAWLVDLPAGLHAGLHVLGDVRAVRRGRLASGRVVDAVGAAARLEYFTAGSEDGGDIRRCTGIVVERAWPTAAGSHEWRCADDVVIDAERSGAFTVTGFDFGDPMRVSAHRFAGARCDPIVFVAPANDLRFVVQPSGGVAGRVLGLATHDASLRVRATAPGQASREASVYRNGRFGIHGLSPGEWMVEFVVPGAGVVARVPHVLVRAGEVSADPRLTGCDLEALHPFRLHVETGTGMPARGRVHTDGGLCIDLDALGVVRLWTAGAPVAVTVEPVECAAFVVDGLTGDRIVGVPESRPR